MGFQIVAGDFEDILVNRAELDQSVGKNRRPSGVSLAALKVVNVKASRGRDTNLTESELEYVKVLVQDSAEGAREMGSA